jgi:hypothetical protein
MINDTTLLKMYAQKASSQPQHAGELSSSSYRDYWGEKQPNYPGRADGQVLDATIES